MLVINNGAIKSGSTWLQNILVKLRDFRTPPEKYLTGNNKKHPCIIPEKLNEFLQSEDHRTNDYISKNHITGKNFQKILLAYDTVRVFDIERDPRDVIVSNYYHMNFRKGYKGSFEDYYWEEGRRLIVFLADYHEVWRNAGSKVFVSSYERLQEQFESEVKRIAEMIEVQLTDEKVTELKKATSLGSLRSEYKDEPRFEGEKFFRKGTIGDWENHFSERMIEDVEKIQQRVTRYRSIRSIMERANRLLFQAHK